MRYVRFILLGEEFVSSVVQNCSADDCTNKPSRDVRRTQYNALCWRHGRTRGEGYESWVVGRIGVGRGNVRKKKGSMKEQGWSVNLYTNVWVMFVIICR